MTPLSSVTALTDLLKIIGKNYLTARADFLAEVEKLYKSHQSTELSGNDNIIGRIGEFVAFQYLVEAGYEIVKPKNLKSNPVYDLFCQKTKKKISVKTITSENEKGRTTRIKEKWDILVLVEIGSDQKVKRIGILTAEQFAAAILKYPKRSSQPYASRSMLNPKGLIGKSGHIVSKENASHYL